MPDQHDRVVLGGQADRLAMDLGDQRAGGVDCVQVSLGSLAADRGRDTVGRVQEMGPLGNFRKVVHEHHPSLRNRDTTQ